MDAEPPQENVAKIGARLGDLRVVGGDALVGRLVSNFRGHLDELASRDGDWPREEVHRILGLAAMLGFDALESLLRSLEDAPERDGVAIEATRGAMKRAIVLLDRLKD